MKPSGCPSHVAGQLVAAHSFGRTYLWHKRVKEDNETQQVQAQEKESKQNSLLMGAIEMIESVDSIICRNWGNTVESN